MATLGTTALNVQHLAGFSSIGEGLQAVMHDTRSRLAMARRQLEPNPSQNVEPALTAWGTPEKPAKSGKFSN